MGLRGWWALVVVAIAMEARAEVSGPTVLKDQTVPMRDGVTLSADVYLPGGQGPGPWPVVLMRTPYDKATRSGGFDAWFAARGYAVVVEDTRGRFASGGHWSLVGVDGPDGYDTTAWIGRQAWSNGRIGTIGTSYEGGTQHAMALAGAPHLTAMVPLFALSDIGEYGVRHDGAFELRFFNWVFGIGSPSVASPKAARRAAADPASTPAVLALADEVEDYVTRLPLRPGTTPLRLAPDYERGLIDYMSHSDDDAYWTDSGFDIIHHVADWEDVPAYHVTGWYDSWSHQVADLNFPLLSAAKKSRQRLIVGPWIHSSPGLSHAGDAQFTPDAAIDLNVFEERWLARWLKGVDNGVDREPPVRIYVMGGGDGHKTPEGRIFVGGHWRDEQFWPLARARYVAWYLQAGGALGPTPPPAGAAPISYTFDPKSPVPTVGGNVSSQGKLSMQGVADQRCHKGVGLCADDLPLSTRNDILVFESSPIDHDMEITGPLVVKLWAATDGPDTDFTAKLIDEWPPSADFPAGYAMNIDDGIVRARYRNSLQSAQPMTPGQPVELTIQLYPTSLLVKAGHRLRVDVSSSNFPRFDVNPNTGEPLNANRRWRTAVNTVFVDAKHPSRIVLPMADAEAGSSESRKP